MSVFEWSLALPHILPTAQVACTVEHKACESAENQIPSQTPDSANNLQTDCNNTAEMEKPEKKDVYMAIYKGMVAEDRRRISQKSDRFREKHEASYTA